METIKKQSEMKATLIDMKNNLQRVTNRENGTENQISDLDYKEAKYTQSEQQEEKKSKKNEDSIRSLWDNFKHTNIRIMGVPDIKEKE